MNTTSPDQFGRVASDYASYRPRYPDGLFAWLASLPARRDLAWDCATGSGQAAIGLATHFARVVATDASAPQITAATGHERVEYRVAVAESSGLPAQSVDLVTVAQALHWLDSASFYVEASRVLAGGGAIAAWTYGTLHLEEERIDQLIQRFYLEDVGAWWPANRRHVESGYRTLPFPFTELSPPAFEMTATWRLTDLLGYMGTWSAVIRCRQATSRDAVEELARELRPAWGDPATSRVIRWPLSLRVGRASSA